MKGKTKIAVLLLFIAVLIGTITPAFACGGGGRGRCHNGFWTTLTNEQRETIHETVMTMMAAGATRDEVRTAVMDLLTGFGIVLPDSCCTGDGHSMGGCDSSCTGRGHRGGGCDSSCTGGGHSGCGGHGGHGGYGDGGCIHDSTSDDDPAVSSVRNTDKSAPNQIAIAKIIPNPFNATAEIQVIGDINSGHTIDIFNMQGRAIRSIPLDGKSIVWDGTDENGQKVGTGTYFIRINGNISSQRIIMMK